MNEGMTNDLVRIITHLEKENERYRKEIKKAIRRCCYAAVITDLRKFIKGESE